MSSSRAVERVGNFEMMRSEKASEQDDSSEDEEYSDDERKSDVVHELSQTTYDAFIMVVCFSSDVEYIRRIGKGRFAAQTVYAVFVHLLNILVQFVLVYYLMVSCVETAAHIYTDRLDERMLLISNHTLSDHPIELNASHSDFEADTLMLCRSKTSLPYAHLIVIFLWMCKMSREFVDALMRLLLVINMRAPRDGEDLVKEEDGKVTITHATMHGKLICLIFVVFPQFLVAAWLTWVGAGYLYFANEMSVIIMKAISLAFITTLDELLFVALMPIGFKSYMKNVKYRRAVAIDNWYWDMLFQGLFKLAIISFMTWFVWAIFFGEVSAFRVICEKYDAIFPNPNKITFGWGNVWNLFKHEGLHVWNVEPEGLVTHKSM